MLYYYEQMKVMQLADPTIKEFCDDLPFQKLILSLRRPEDLIHVGSRKNSN
jgi:hypothetical protein